MSKAELSTKGYKEGRLVKSKVSGLVYTIRQIGESDSSVSILSKSSIQMRINTSELGVAYILAN